MKTTIKDTSLRGCVAARGFWALDRLIGGDARRALCGLGVEQIDTLIRALNDIAAEGQERGWSAETSLRRRLTFAVAETCSDVLDVTLDRAECAWPWLHGTHVDRWLSLLCIELHRTALAAKGT